MSSSSSLRFALRALHQLDRAAKQQRKANIKLYRARKKQRAIANAAEAVKNFENYVDKPPVKTTEEEDQASSKRSNYSPSFFARLLRLDGWQRKRLDRKIEHAREKDASTYLKDKAKYDSDLTEWTSSQVMAKGVLAKDVKTYKQVLDFFEPFAEMSELGTRMQLSLLPDSASVDLFLNSTAVIPKEVLSQTSTGKLSREAMSASRSNSLY